ncbi:MAG: tetratricopeptide repeat protein [Phycisphaerae bacterium]|nr:tetratricopeptide repeat protein [Saprospiraceae bacterium]
MSKQFKLSFIGLMLFLNEAPCQTFKQQFADLFSEKDTLRQLNLLKNWESADSQDPELYIAYFNYYVNKSTKEIVTLGNNPKGEDVLQILDNDSSSDAPVAFIYGDTYYDPEILENGFDYIDKGIKLHPTRLDMRFGKTYMFGKVEDYENLTVEIIKTLDYSVAIQNKWMWADNKPVDDPKNFLLGNIQNYVLQLYNTENDDLLENMKRIAEAALKYYPDHIESLTNLSIVYSLRKEYDKALESLLIAYKLDPKDSIVLLNIAQAYKLKGENKNAIKYYKLSAKYGERDSKAYAEEQIEILKKL